MDSKIRINIDGLDLMLVAGIIGGFWKNNWQPVSVLVLVVLALSFMKAFGSKN